MTMASGVNITTATTTATTNRRRRRCCWIQYCKSFDHSDEYYERISKINNNVNITVVVCGIDGSISIH